MKKLLIALLIIISLLVASVVLIPVIFKDDIKAALDSEIKNALNASVYYDENSFEISLFQDFPNLSLSLSQFGIVGNDQFSEDTLVSVGNFNLGIDLLSVISGDQIAINSLSIVNPDILILVLPDGTANYDITKPSQEEVTTSSDETEGSISISIKKWEIIGGNMVYFDESLPFYTSLSGIDHEGSGNFAEDIFDMVTATTIESSSLGYDGTEYVSNKKLSAEVTMGMDLAKNTYTFKENVVQINDLPLSFEGNLALKENGDILTDFTYDGQSLGIKSILSLIPGVYQEYLTGLNAAGSVTLNGFVKGKVTETELPAVRTEIKVVDGNIKHNDFPSAIESIQINAVFDYPSADLTKSSFDINQFSLLLEGEKTEATLHLKNFENFHWDLAINSHLDLEKITKVIPMEEGLVLKGRIEGEIKSQGQLVYIEQEQYDQLPTSGNLRISNFEFSSKEVTEPFGISIAEASFDPKQVELKEFKGTSGNSDFSARGSLSNHLAYAFKPDERLVGILDFSANTIDLNELMVSSGEETESTTVDTTSIEVVQIPENIDFTLNSSIGKLIYDNLDITDTKGTILVRNGEVILDGLNFKLLEGTFDLTGVYDPRDAEKPAFGFSMDIKDLSIPQAFKNFETIQKLAPIAEKMKGKFSTDFAMNGTLDQAMNPIYDQLSGRGILQLAQASLANIKSLQKLSAVSKLNASDGTVALKDVLMSAEVKDGRVTVEPFDVKIGSYKTNVTGSSGIDGSLDYDLRMLVPANSVTSTVTSTLSKFAGKSFGANSDLILRINMGGTYADPKPTLGGVETQEGKSIQSAVKSEVRAKVEEKKEEIKQQVDATKDSLLNEGKVKVNTVKAEVKDQTKKTVTKELDKAKDQLKGLFKRKKKKKN